MTSERERKLQKIIPPLLFIIYLFLHIFIFAYIVKLAPLEPAI